MWASVYNNIKYSVSQSGMWLGNHTYCTNSTFKPVWPVADINLVHCLFNYYSSQNVIKLHFSFPTTVHSKYCRAELMMKTTCMHLNNWQSWFTVPESSDGSNTLTPLQRMLLHTLQYIFHLCYTHIVHVHVAVWESMIYPHWSAVGFHTVHVPPFKYLSGRNIWVFVPIHTVHRAETSHH